MGQYWPYSHWSRGSLRLPANSRHGIDYFSGKHVLSFRQEGILLRAPLRRWKMIENDKYVSISLENDKYVSISLKYIQGLRVEYLFMCFSLNNTIKHMMPFKYSYGPGVGATPLVCLSKKGFFWFCTSAYQMLWLVFKFDECHRSWAAVTRVKYECDIKQVTNDFIYLNNWKNDGKYDTGVVTPTPQFRDVDYYVGLSGRLIRCSIFRLAVVAWWYCCLLYIDESWCIIKHHEMTNSFYTRLSNTSLTLEYIGTYPLGVSHLLKYVQYVLLKRYWNGRFLVLSISKCWFGKTWNEKNILCVINPLTIIKLHEIMYGDGNIL